MEDPRTQAKAKEYWQKNPQSRRGTLGPWGKDQLHNGDTLSYYCRTNGGNKYGKSKPTWPSSPDNVGDGQRNRSERQQRGRNMVVT